MTPHARVPGFQFQRARNGVSRWAVLFLVLSACSGDKEPTGPTVVPVTTVAVTPGTSTLAAFGATVQLSAAASGAGGGVVAGKTFTWVSSSPTVATVNASGLVTTVADGTATISATTDGVAGSATVTVAQSVSSVAVTPATATLTSLGDTLRFDGVAVDANGNAVAGAAATTWASSDPLIAAVDATGLATAVAFGSVTITATSGTSTGTATLAITRVIATAEITPTVGTITTIGGTTQFVAVARDPAGNVIPGVAFAWASSDTLVATVDATGLTTAVSLGAATITASADTVQAAASVTVVLSGTGSGTLGVIADVNANDLGGGAFSTDFSVVLTNVGGGAVSGATVTIGNTTLGVVTLAESGTLGTYLANRPSFPGGQFELDIVSGVDNIMDVVAIGPGVHAITAPLVNDTLVALQPMAITWTTPTQAGAAELETRDFTSLAFPDTGAFAVPGVSNIVNTSQRIRVFRSNEVDIAGGLAASRFKIKIRAQVEPVVVIPLQRALSVTGSSTGTGTVTSVPAGINCTSTAGVETGTCSTAFDDGTAVALTFLAAPGSDFVAWTTDCTGGAACNLTMDGAKTVDARFDRTPPPANLLETWEATSVIFTPAGGGTAVDIIAGGETVVAAFRQDFTYTITSTEPGPPVVTDVENGTYTVLGGTVGVGATLTFTPTGLPADPSLMSLIIDALTATALNVSGANETFDFNDDGFETPATLVAVFQIQATAPAQRSLTVTGSGSGTGAISSVPAGIDCIITVGLEVGTCSTTFDDATAVALTRTPIPGSAFTSWSGDCAGSSTCNLTMDADKTVDAQIDMLPPPANLVGTWGATSVTFTPTGGGTAVDIIAQGVTLTVVLRADFTYTTTEVDTGTTDVENGTYMVIGGVNGVGAVLTFTPTGLPADEALTIDALTATDLTVSNLNDAFDFNDDGFETPASLVAVLVKQ